MGMPSCPAGGKGTTVPSNRVYKVPGMRNKRSAKFAEQRFQEMLRKLRRDEAKEAFDAQWAEEWGEEGSN